MIKPVVRNRPYYDYIEVRNYINTKYPDLNNEGWRDLMVALGVEHNGVDIDIFVMAAPDTIDEFFNELDDDVKGLFSVLRTEFPDLFLENGPSLHVWW